MHEPTRCPTCSTETLSSYHLERQDAQVHECAACGGVWVSREVVHALGRKPRAESLPEPAALPSETPEQPRLHRHCPACNILMNRKRCGAVVLDVCTLHGVWFDRGELNSFVGWVQAEAERHLQALPGVATAQGATIFEYLGLLGPVATLLEAVCGLFDV